MKTLGVCLLGLFLSVGAFSAEPVVLVTGDWEPYTSSRSAESGFFTEVVLAVAREAGWLTRIEFMGWKRCEAEIQAGAAFAAFPYIKSAERDKLFWFTDPVISGRSVLAYEKGRVKPPAPWKAFADFAAFRLGGVKGYWYEPVFAKAGLKVDYSASDDSAFQKLAAGRIEMIATDELVVKTWYTKNFPDRELEIWGGAINEDPLRLMVSRTYPDSAKLILAFNQALERFKASSAWPKLLAKYKLTA